MKTNKPQKNIPEGWQETKLADIGVFSKGSGITKDQLTKTGHNAIRYGELYTKFNFKIEKIYSHIPTEVIPTSTKIKYGDILFAGSGETNEEIGKSAAYLLNQDCYAGGDLIIFTPKNADSLFLSYSLNIGEGRKKLTELGQGQSVVHIYKSEIEKLKLHLPPLLEQSHIVAVLEIWDKVIEKLTRKIEAKKQIKKVLMQELLTGKKRLTGFNENWYVTELKKIAEIFSGGTPDTSNKYFWDGNINWITPTEITRTGKYIIQQTEKKITDLGLKNSSAKLLPKNSLIICTRATVGECAISTYPISTNQGFKNLVPKSNTNVEYLYYFIKSIKNKLIKLGSGSTFLEISKGDIEKLKIHLPPIDEQTAIAQILATADKEIAELAKKLSIIKEQKRYLLNNLITGTIRTPETLSTKLKK